MAPWWRKFKRCTEGKKSVKSRYSNYEKGSALSQSALGSLQVSRCHSFSNQARTQDPPPPENDSPSFELGGFSKTLPNSPLSGHGNDPKQQLAPDTWGDLATASVSSDSSVDTHDQHGSQLLSLQASDYESKNVTAVNSPSRHQDNVSIISRRILKDQKKPDILPSEDHIPITERGPFGTQVTKLQIAPRPSFFSVPTVPDSNITSPSRSPVKACDHEQVKSGSGLETPCSDMNLVGSGRFCHLDSDKILGPSAVTDMSFIWPHSSECSPIPSPRVLSPGRGCHIQSGGATPLHPRSARFCTELFVDRQDNVKPESHKLPLPPATASSCPFSSSSSAVKSLTPTRNHGQAEMSTSPVTRWKKGRPIGSGTYGQVYLGFNSDTGEMCAIKEVTLFSDDYRSKESAQQLGQEITLLSRLRHPNIVRYFGSEMVDNKLCIYLEYVSGGSVYKILREYGELGESAIRSYTQQILSGLVYLHSKKTVHRDIKGANILVDPNGRVKLADFGMAKHITGGSCPWSFKGSPYWMAPEVIQNSNRCNLAVDIWSLGCTVIEMATTKPPWSQYEGVAALFKIGNSKEHPPIPDHLSEEGKDFVRQCLQRNPQDRPTAIRLLEHPFIRNAASSERWVQISDPLEPIHSAEKSRGKDSVKTISSLALEGMPMQLSKDSKTGPGSRNPHMSKHISCPVSPIGSPLLQPKSSQPMCKRSLVASYQTASGSTTPHTNGNVTLPVNHLDHSLRYPHDVMGARKPKKSPYSCGNPFYSTRKLEILSGVPEASQINENIASCQCDVEGSKPVPSNYQKPEGFCNRQSILAGRVSQQLLTHHLS